MISDIKDKVRIGIIGGGWYGCHLAVVLRERGFEVTIFERHDRLITEGSRWNQFRLHQGFHYARSWQTRAETIRGFHMMRQVYPTLTSFVKENYYAVANDSLLDMGTVMQVMDSSNLTYEIIETEKTKLKNVEGVLRCFEQTFLPVKAQEHFTQLLDGHVRCNTTVTNVKENSDGISIVGDGFEERFDFVIDCTYNHLQLNKAIPNFFEPCLTLTYRHSQQSVTPPSYTIIDGNFLSMFEYHDNNGIPLFTLTSVVDTPLGQYELAVDAEKRIATFGDEELAKKRIIFEEQASHFIKDFAKDYVYVDYFLSCKTKLMSGSANRECVEYHTGRLMSLFGGKITGIFHAENFVFDWLNAKLGSLTIQPEFARYFGRALITNSKSDSLGKFLSQRTQFTDIYDESNLFQIGEKCHELIVCCDIPTEKHVSSLKIRKWAVVMRGFQAGELTTAASIIRDNDRPSLSDTLKLLSRLRRVKCRKFVYISSIDVLDSEGFVLNEDSPASTDEASGNIMCERRMESSIPVIFPDNLIIRLPFVFGGKLSSNKTIFDLLSKLKLSLLDPNQAIQLYDAERLWRDISLAISADLDILHLTSEPVKMEEVGTLFGLHYCATPAFEIIKDANISPRFSKCSVSSKYAMLWASDRAFIIHRSEIMERIRVFFRHHHVQDLAVSNTAWSQKEELLALEILQHHGITKLSISPTLIWPKWHGIDKVSAERYRQRMAEQKMEVVSIHSCLHERDDLHLFESDVSRERLIDHMRTVIMLATWLRAKTVVFSSPRHRKLHGLTPTQAFQIAAAVFKTLAQFAEKLGVTLCIEPTGELHGSEFGRTPEEVEKVVDSAMNSYLSMSIDIGLIRSLGLEPLTVIQEQLAICSQIDYSEPELGALIPGQFQAHNKSLARKMIFDGVVVLKMKPAGLLKFSESVKLFCEGFGARGLM